MLGTIFTGAQNRKSPPWWCMRCTNTCTVHVVGEFLRGVVPGVKPLAAWRPGMVLFVLRDVLKSIGVDVVLSREHADDLLRRGATLLEIIRAGDWRSAALLTYLDAYRHERDSSMEAHLRQQ